MQTIHKDTLIHGCNKITVPIGSTILTVQNQNDTITIWYECWITTSNVTTEITLYVFGTGQVINENNVKYIGTVQVSEYVWHIYEQLDQ